VRNRWRSYLRHPLIVGFVLSLIVIFVLARYLPRYFTELVEKSVISNNGEVYYFDIDNDGNSEKLHYYQYDRIFLPTLYLYDSNDNFKCLWNFLESPIKNSEIFAGDYNNDNLKEIFVFTEKSDSVYLHILNPKDKKESVVNRKFIKKIASTDSITRIIPIGLYYLNNKDSKEFLFAINSTNHKVTGELFSYNIEDNRLSSNLKLNVEIIKPILVEDINKDGALEIIVSNRSDENSGNEAQFIVLNNKLDLLFQPVVFQGGHSKVTSTLIRFEQEEFIAVLNSGINPDNILNSLKLFNFSGEQVKEIDIDEKSNLSLVSLPEYQDNIWLISNNEVYKYSANLKKDKDCKICNCQDLRFFQIKDVTGDNKQEIVFKSTNSLLIFSEDFKDKIKLTFPNKGKLNLTPVFQKDKPNLVSIQIGKNWYLYKFYKNEAFFYGNIFYLLIYIGITFLVFSIHIFRLKLIQLKKSVFKVDESKFINEIESNIEEKFTGLKSKINEISNDLQVDSYSEIINEIDETYEEVKTISKKISKKSDLGNDFKTYFEKLVNNKRDSLNLSYYIFPEDITDIIKIEVKELIFDFCQNCVKIVEEYSQNANAVLQLIQHDENLNVLIEIENVFFETVDIDKKLEKKFVNLKGKFEVNTYSDFGTIISLTVPLNFGDTKDNGTKIKLIIAEDHDVSLFGLVSLFKTKDDIELVGTAKNGMEVLKILETKSTDIIITDISMPGMDGIELSERLKIEYPNIKVIVFTMYMENWFIEKLTSNGAKGFVSKNSKMIELIGAVRNVYEGNNYYCPQFKSKFGLKTNGNGISKKLDSLTQNELQIVKLYAENLDRKQIAEKMNLNKNTIDIFIANILLKLKAGDEEEVIRIAKKQKIISE